MGKLQGRAALVTGGVGLAIAKLFVEEEAYLFITGRRQRELDEAVKMIGERLPNLKLIASTGAGNATIDLEAARQRHIDLLHTGYFSTPTIEFTWAMILAVARNLTTENTSLRSGGWQIGVGSDLRGKTLAVLGLGNVGGQLRQSERPLGCAS